VSDLGLPAHGTANGAEAVHHVDVTVAALRSAHVEPRSVVAHLEEQAASMHAAGFLRGWVQSGLIIGADLPP